MELQTEILSDNSKIEDLRGFLDGYTERFNQIGFIENDPVSIPHRYIRLQDIEIMALWTAMLSWGNRKSIIQSCNKIAALMDDSPHDFILNHIEQDRARFDVFVHRTFNSTDAIYFLEFFQNYYRSHDSLEDAFAIYLSDEDINVEKALTGFHNLFFDHPYAPERTRKHIATPLRKSTCKRLNMFLRWMVRKDDKGVDFGLWQKISPAQLLLPLDVHVDNVARNLGLIDRKQTDWLTVLELTDKMKLLDPNDPVKYDFALFGLGVDKYFV